MRDISHDLFDIIIFYLNYRRYSFFLIGKGFMFFRSGFYFFFQLQTAPCSTSKFCSFRMPKSTIYLFIYPSHLLGFDVEKYCDIIYNNRYVCFSGFLPVPPFLVLFATIRFVKCCV